MIRIGITHGDVNGIGYEMILKVFSDSRVSELFTPVLYGSSKIAAYHRKTMEMQNIGLYAIDQASDAVPNRVNIINCIEDEVKVELGRYTSESGNAALLSLERAVKDINGGLIDAIVTSPAIINEVQKNGIKYSGQTALIEASVEKNNESLGILVKDNLRIALVTGNIPLSEVSNQLTEELIFKKLSDLKCSLIRDFAVSAPRIAVLSLNPNITPENPGKEETEQIIPAMDLASKSGIFCFGPYAPDEFFGSGHYTKFDGILAMYHDQGLVPFKTLAAEEGVYFSASLPIVRTAPNMGPSFDIAGQNNASEIALLNSIYLAIDILKNRKTDDEINSNPLKKHYYEKGSDNEKLDLTSDNL
ncbi:MAG: 4-hydroxythreonine-4-phosphate dehydrogenase PdxA [Dysgonamonadaceae bacterium]|jgi:4-hydroxythreonine-4-phosphate dehydrogenase|nr:4-hydroxythreonine-4-phosphate dehydrogenase PdxA [Dysgonamonadaceae bacterium]